jgi:hypothetical protein
VVDGKIADGPFRAPVIRFRFRRREVACMSLSGDKKTFIPAKGYKNSSNLRRWKATLFAGGVALSTSVRTGMLAFPNERGVSPNTLSTAFLVCSLVRNLNDCEMTNLW